MSRLCRLSNSIGVLLLATPLLSALSAQTAARDTAEHAVAVIASSVPIVTPIAMSRTVTERALSPAPVIPAGVTQSNDVVGSRANRVAIAPGALPASSSRSQGSSAMMIVGGAAFITGAVVGGNAGSAVMIGGGILGLIGLWRYMH